MGGYIGARAGSLSTTTVANVQDVTATDTTPEVTIINNTHEDTDGGREGKVIFKGQQSGGEESTLAEIQASHDGTADDEKGDLIFKTNDGSDGASPTEAMRIDSGQNVLIGKTDAETTISGGTPAFQITGAGFDSISSHTRREASASGAALILAKSRNTTPNNYTIVQDNDTLGSLIFIGDDGTNLDTYGATITAAVDGTPGANDLPARLTFSTTADGAASPTERMRIDSSGNLNIGSDTNVGYGPLQIGSTSSTPTVFQMLSSTSGNNSIHFGDGTSGGARYRGYVQYGHADDALQFGTAESERMRIDSSGDMLVATTDDGASGAGFVVKNEGTYGHLILKKTYSGNATGVHFYHNGSAVGTINYSNSSTTYNTSSDYRLKENVTNVTDGITRVKQLAPKRFNFIADADTTVDGFLAHEAQAVVPEAVHGTKDEVDDDGNAVMQGIDQSKLVPLLTAALQEAIAKIETLETKVAALEAE